MTETTLGSGQDPNPQELPVPFAGYDDADVPTIAKYIEDIPEGDAREMAKAAIRAAEEQREKPRKGVLDVTEPTPDTPPPAPEGASDQDDSGRPPLEEVAAERVANRYERVINTRQED